jgi:outer membrane protein assembly factor BamA
VLTGTMNVENGRTEAQDLFFCRAFERCIPEDIEKVRESRWTNWVALGLVHTATRGPVQAPTGGYTVRAGVDYASSLLGSDDGYLRGVAEAAVYREVRRGWLLSGRLTAGTFLTGFIEGDDGYIPPERRFYAGGPNSVRGFPRNDLGPQVYVAEAGNTGPGDPVSYTTSDITASATGGTQTVIASAELETPFPIYSQYLRFAAFVDAGQVWDRVNDCRSPGDSLPKVRCSVGLRVTPGAGLRIATPVGPIRLDVAYNPYRREAGPLYLYDGETGEFIEPLGIYQPPPPDRFWDRLTFQVAVGRAF